MCFTVSVIVISFLLEQGCLDALEDSVNDNLALVIGVLSGVIILQACIILYAKFLSCWVYNAWPNLLTMFVLSVTKGVWAGNFPGKRSPQF